MLTFRLSYYVYKSVQNSIFGASAIFKRNCIIVRSPVSFLLETLSCCFLILKHLPKYPQGKKKNRDRWTPQMTLETWKTDCISHSSIVASFWQSMTRHIEPDECNDTRLFHRLLSPGSGSETIIRGPHRGEKRSSADPPCEFHDPSRDHK
ncbi:hypothetical protein TNIN_66051 [Trichonephila inaurata madagascariensis]|uniref:Uncharacterized protein n=1 Tax=Trichonephila inaurata madagascariensis TaxID=2747483 RepID=A0A8X6XCG3_9ARAC|nr:hypothetical protein TNIN_66051 [Trichonephila inaurata madagascariensis]